MHASPERMASSIACEELLYVGHVPRPVVSRFAKQEHTARVPCHSYQDSR